MENSNHEMPAATGPIALATASIVDAVMKAGTIAIGSIEDLGSLVTNVRSRLMGETPVGAIADVQREPAVSLRKSVRNDHLVCLECGEKMKMLKRHLNTSHGLSPEEYRQRWNLSGDYPLVAPDYAEVRRDLAIKIGLGRKPGQKRGRKKKMA